MNTPVAASGTAWWREVDAPAWRALFAAGAGWMLDAMDVMLYAVALKAIAAEFQLSQAVSGAVMSASLIASAVGGVVSGILADRFGRTRMLMISIASYSIFTALTATSQNLGQLVFWRVLVGLGMGGEWSAGAVLVAETWPAKHRGKAIGLMQSGWAIGYILAAVIGGLVLPTWGWRPMFVIGLAPALLVVWIRFNLAEPALWARQATRATLSETMSALTRRANLSRMLIATAVSSALLFSYWGLFNWVPAFLSKDVAGGGAGLSVVKSTAWVVAMQVGAFLGYTSFGFIADRLGRKPTFIAFVLGAAVLVPIYGLSARNETILLVLGPFVGFFGHGYFSVFGAMLAELFPLSIRGAASGICYNFGRAASAAAPWTVGALADRHGLGVALLLTSVLYVVGAILVLFLPETRGKEMD